MNKETEYIILFKSIRQVIKAEKHGVSKGINQRVMPVPRHISSECGMCLVVDNQALELMSQFLEENNIPFRVEEKSNEKK